jgi:HEPN domain-containing protein
MKPREESKRELAEKWLMKAREDLGLAEHLLEEGIYLNAIGYSSQQASEKFLKAFLVLHQIEFPKTHDLAILLDLIETIAPAIAGSLRDITVLNDYGVDVRYPGDLPDLDTRKARKAVELAAKVRDEISKGMK